MVKVGISKRTEHRISRQTNAKRVAGKWDPMLTRQTIQLEDGRCLTYFLDGPQVHSDNSANLKRQQIPHIFVFHAAFLSGNSFLMQQAPKDCVLVCVNRPGYWGSDPAPKGYTYRDFARDMEQLANYLQLEHFWVAGHSSGGPCALACAACLPDRVRGVGLLSSDPEYAHESAPDRGRMNDVMLGKVLPFVLESIVPFVPTSKNARKGLSNDTRLESAPYPFETDSIQQPTVIYVGANDTILPPSIAKHWHERLGSTSTLTIVPDKGHLDVLDDDTLQPFLRDVLQASSENSGDQGKHHPNYTPKATLSTLEMPSASSLLSSLRQPVPFKSSTMVRRVSTASTAQNDDEEELDETQESFHTLISI